MASLDGLGCFSRLLASVLGTGSLQVKLTPCQGSFWLSFAERTEDVYEHILQEVT